ncbi:MAG: T9SS C-terminal target domain-containing protein [Saprospirales bacterium]|nr:MAG: T9SS C-terminal target domain-containing protein [Saprospirales bacterium]
MKSILLSAVLFFAFNVFSVFAQDTTKVEIIIDCQNEGDFIDYYLLVQNFEEMEAVQGTIVWDADSLSFVEFENIGIPSFSSNNNLNLNEVNNGVLRFVWFNPGSVGATIPDGEPMFKLRFEINEGLGKVALTGDPVQLLFLDKDFEEVSLEISYGNACVISSINNLFPKDDVFFYPNPVIRGQELNLGSKNGPGEFQYYSIFSADGKMVYSAASTPSLMIIQLPQSLNPGNYFLQLQDKQNRTHTAQLIVE